MLLTHAGAAEGGGAPYASIVTHGFVVDERGAKMSKSVGNVITPAQLLEGSQKASGAAAALALLDCEDDEEEKIRAAAREAVEQAQADEELEEAQEAVAEAEASAAAAKEAMAAMQQRLEAQ